MSCDSKGELTVNEGEGLPGMVGRHLEQTEEKPGEGCATGLLRPCWKVRAGGGGEEAREDQAT